VIRILTEDKDRELIKKTVSSYASGYTLTPGEGMWMGVPEPSLAIDLVDVSAEDAENIAKVIKFYNKQESVLIIDFPTTHKFI
jgi:hypothetical protein